VADESTSLVIKEHDFKEAKNSLKKFTEKAQQDVELSRVPYDGGLFHLGNHKVTGTELNEITGQIQEYFIKINNLNAGLVGEFRQVYNAFESLDKDYMTAIVNSFKATEKVSQREKEDFKKMLEEQEKSVKVLKKFKADIDKLKHITDVDKAWELINQQGEAVKALRDYQNELSKYKHLMDVDKLWEDGKSLTKQVGAIDARADDIDRELSDVGLRIDSVEALIEDIEIKIDEFIKTVEEQGTTLSEFAKVIEECRRSQQEFIESTSQAFNDYQAVIDQRLNKNEQAMRANFNSLNEGFERMQSDLNKQVKVLSTTQDKKFAELELSQASALERISQDQTLALESIKEAQADKLEQVSKDQLDQLAHINRSLEEEKKSLHSTVDKLTQKIKTAYIVAGTAATLTVVHIILNIIGII
jgi:chromosome segregation ATPase